MSFCVSRFKLVISLWEGRVLLSVWVYDFGTYSKKDRCRNCCDIAYQTGYLSTLICMRVVTQMNPRSRMSGVVAKPSVENPTLCAWLQATSCNRDMMKSWNQTHFTFEAFAVKSQLIKVGTLENARQSGGRVHRAQFETKTFLMPGLSVLVTVRSILHNVHDGRIGASIDTIAKEGQPISPVTKFRSS